MGIGGDFVYGILYIYGYEPYMVLIRINILSAYYHLSVYSFLICIKLTFF